MNHAEQGTHCGHDCCTEPHYPYHDHFLSPQECSGCERVTARERALRAEVERLERAVETAQIGRPAIYPCPECGEPRWTRADKTSHIGNSHCPACIAWLAS